MTSPRSLSPTGIAGPLVCLAALAAAGCQDPSTSEMPAGTTQVAEFVGGTACAGCHDEQITAWQGSHHDLAMQVATADTVLGDFSGRTFSYNGVTSTFLRQDGRYIIRTDDAEGRLADFQVTHTFGVTPLQQYLVEFPRGRSQVTTLAWDARPQEDGGQRWFSVYAERDIEPGSPLHWTGVFQNWNSSCAFCHSTGLQKHYDPDEDTFQTGFERINVDCEACHGPASLHVVSPTEWPLGPPPDDADWVFDPDNSIARRQPAHVVTDEIERCARCHSRRGQLSDDIAPGAALLDGFRPALLDAELYYADGQIRDEVYVWGSFLQSRMHAAGVSCSDCHDPHSVRLRADGNAVCARCHLASNYETPAHHHHETGAAGSRCVDCHMPATTYMVVDPRRDHSFRVPRPDLSTELGTPNACAGCHADRDDAWAADAVRQWFPGGRSGKPHYGQALFAGRHWTSDRAARLRGLATDASQPAIARATAVSLLAEQTDADTLPVILDALGDESPLIQLAALQALAPLPDELRIDYAFPFLDHPLLALRLEAVRQLLPGRELLRQDRREALDAALDEYRAFLAFNSDRGEGLLQSAALHTALGQLPQAEQLLRTAIERHPWFAAAYVNLADLYRQSGRDDESLALLEAAVDNAAEDPASHFALGLALVRAGKTDEAVASLERAASLTPESPYYAYVHGIALSSTGDSGAALALLGAAHERFAGYRDIVLALTTMHRDAGNRAEALRYARALLELSPGDARVLGLIGELQ